MIIGTFAGGLIGIDLSAGYSACELRYNIMEEMIAEIFNHPRNFIANGSNQQLVYRLVIIKIKNLNHRNSLYSP